VQVQAVVEVVLVVAMAEASVGQVVAPQASVQEVVATVEALVVRAEEAEVVRVEGEEVVEVLVLFGPVP
jgi:hypothetical protein